MLSYAADIPLLLQNKVRVLIYNGDADYMCNWYGVQSWIKSMKWPGQAAFLNAPLSPFLVDGQCPSKSSSTITTLSRTNISLSRVPSPPSPSALRDLEEPVENGVCGWYQNVLGLTFARIKDAGHLAPMDQPTVLLNLINAFLHNSPLKIFSYLS